MTVLLEARAISKAYGKGTGRVPALEDVSLQIRAGTITAVVGRSGSGKSTLLHCLSTIAAPDTGSVLLDGSDVGALDDDGRSEVRRTRMSFVFQRGNLAPALTVAENVSAGLVLRKAGRTEIRSRVDDALQRCGLAGRAGSYPAELSGGEQQRAALARALAPSPDLLWADEPTGALDRSAATELMQLLSAATTTGTAVVVVSHDEQVAALADQCVRLLDGRRIE
jgi:putative ABC transport system ATP-binding protein